MEISPGTLALGRDFDEDRATYDSQLEASASEATGQIVWQQLIVNTTPLEDSTSAQRASTYFSLTGKLS